MAKSVKAGSAYVELGVKNSVDKGLRAAQKSLKKFGTNVAKVGAAVTGLGASVAGPLAGMAVSFAGAGDKLHKMSIRTGIAVESLSGLAFAAEQSGTDIDSLSQAMFRANRRIGNATSGTGPAVRALEELGLAADSLSQMSPEEQFYVLVESLQGVENQARRNQMAFELFGDNFRQIQPLIAEGASGIRELTKEAGELGHTLTNEDAKAAAEFTDSLNRMKSAVGGVKNQIGAALAPVLTKAADALAGVISGVVKFVKENRALIVMVGGVATAITGIGMAIAAFGTLAIAASAAIGGIATVLGFLMSPIGLVIAGFAALGVAIYKYTDLGVKAIEWLQGRFGPLIKTVQGAFAGISEAFKAGDLTAAWEITMDTFEMLWLDLTGELRNIWSGFMDWFTDVSAGVAIGIGKMFSALGNVLTSLLDRYKSVYNKIYNEVVEAGGELGGVRTIGGPVDAYSGTAIGNVDASIRGALAGITEFGDGMQDAARSNADQAKADRAAREKERQARLAELRARLQGMEGAGTAAGAKEEPAQQNPLLAMLEGNMGNIKEAFAGYKDWWSTFGEELTSGGVADEINKSTSTRGAFSGAGAMLLGGALSNPQERTARNTEKMVSEQQRTNKELSQQKARFAV